MRIDLNAAATQLRDAEQLSRGRSTAAGNSEQTSADAANLTSQQGWAMQISAGAQFPEIRQEKVAALAQMVRNGTYAVSSEQTADALMSQMRQLPAA